MVDNTQTNSSKAVAVGRLKEEIRPCVLVEFETQPNDEYDNDGRSSHTPTARGQAFYNKPKPSVWVKALATF